MPKQIKCPFDDGIMVRISSTNAMELLVNYNSPIAKMVGGNDAARGKWYECPSCHFVALFRKEAGE